MLVDVKLVQDTSISCLFFLLSLSVSASHVIPTRTVNFFLHNLQEWVPIQG